MIPPTPRPPSPAKRTKAALGRCGYVWSEGAWVGPRRADDLHREIAEGRIAPATPLLTDRGDIVFAGDVAPPRSYDWQLGLLFVVWCHYYAGPFTIVSLMRGDLERGALRGVEMADVRGLIFASATASCLAAFALYIISLFFAFRARTRGPRWGFALLIALIAYATVASAIGEFRPGRMYFRTDEEAPAFESRPIVPRVPKEGR